MKLTHRVRTTAAAPHSPASALLDEAHRRSWRASRARALGAGAVVVALSSLATTIVACGSDAAAVVSDASVEDAAPSTDGGSSEIDGARADGSSSDANDTVDVTTVDGGAVPSFGTNPGGLKMYVHIPSGLPSGAPVVLALHGCTQTASDYMAAGWNQLADLRSFAVVYPEQQPGNNATRCFRWFDSAQNKRGQGEAESLRQMASYMKDHYGSSLFFVTGLSAGGAMTAVLLATYPDVFKSGAIMAGIPYGCAGSTLEALSCSNPGSDKTPLAWGELVRAAYQGYAGPFPTVSIWQGTSDNVVAPANMTQLAQQWTNVNGVDAVADVSVTVLGATHEEYKDNGGAVRVETYSIPKMAHGTALAPGLAAAGGCGAAGPYMIDAGICSTYYAGKFFGLVP